MEEWLIMFFSSAAFELLYSRVSFFAWCTISLQMFTVPEPCSLLTSLLLKKTVEAPIDMVLLDSKLPKWPQFNKIHLRLILDTGSISVLMNWIRWFWFMNERLMYFGSFVWHFHGSSRSIRHANGYTNSTLCMTASRWWFGIDENPAHFLPNFSLYDVCKEEELWWSKRSDDIFHIMFERLKTTIS